MGAGQSTSPQAQTSHALHVLRVTPSSPASQTSIEPFFDFIVGYNNIDFFSAGAELDATELERIVEEHEESVLDLLVWSSKTRETRGLSPDLLAAQILKSAALFQQWFPSCHLADGPSHNRRLFLWKTLVPHLNHLFLALACACANSSLRPTMSGTCLKSWREAPRRVLVSFHMATG